MQHFCDEDPKPQQVRAHFEVNPFRTWYYHISPNFRTLVILLQVDPTSSDEPRTVYEGCYKTKDTPIFTFFQFPTLNIIIGCGV
jgi:hypothetical protein